MGEALRVQHAVKTCKWVNKPDLSVRVVSDKSGVDGIVVRVTVGKIVQKSTTSGGGFALFHQLPKGAAVVDVELAGDLAEQWHQAQSVAASVPADMPAIMNLRPSVIAKARELNADYLAARQTYFDWFADEARLGWNVIAQWSRLLFKSDEKFAGRIDEAELKKWEQQDKQEAEHRRRYYEEKSKPLVELLDTEEFLQDCRSLPEEQQLEVYAELTEGLIECEVGRTYMAAQVKNDGSFLNQGLYKKYKVARKVNTAVFKILAAWAPIFTLVKKKEVINVIQKVVTVQLFEVVPDPQKMFRIIRYDHPVGTQEVWQREIRLEKRDVDVAGLTKPVKKLFELALDAFNLAMALDALKDKQGSKEIVGAVGALSSLVDKFEMTYNALNATQVAGTALGRKIVMKKASQAAGKVTILGVVSGFCEAYTNAVDASDRWDRGDYNAAIGYGMSMIGGGLTAVFSILILAGVMATAGIWLIAAAAVLSLAGSIIAWLSDDSPMELWASHNFFGKRYSAEDKAFAKWRNDYRAQLRGLELAAFSVFFDADFEDDSCVVSIQPAVLFEFSAVNGSVSFNRKIPRPVLATPLWRSSTTRFDDKKLREVPDESSGTLEVVRDGQRIVQIRVRGQDGKKEKFDEVDIELELDLYGDGRFLRYQGNLTSSMLERVVRSLEIQRPPKTVYIGLAGQGGR